MYNLCYNTNTFTHKHMMKSQELFRETRLLFREGMEEQPQVSKTEKLPIEIKSDLKSLETNIYNALRESTKDRAIDTGSQHSVTCVNEDGTKETYGFRGGNLIQKEKLGFFMVSGNSVLFVPNEGYTGVIQANGQTVERARPQSTAEAKPELKEADSAKPVEVQKSTIFKLPVGTRGIRSERGERLTFLPGERTIKNSLGTLVRTNENNNDVTFTPAVGLTETIYANDAIIFPIAAKVSEDVKKPEAQADNAKDVDKPVEAAATPKKNSADTAEASRTPLNERVKSFLVPGAKDKSPDQAKVAKPSLNERMKGLVPPRKNVEESQRVSIASQVEASKSYLESANAMRKMEPSMREFLRLYTEFGARYDANGEIGRMVYLSEDYKKLTSILDRDAFEQTPNRLEKTARMAIERLVMAMVGSENETTERNKYITQYNSRIRSGAHSVEDAYYDIMDTRYIAQPRGKFNADKKNRVPLYRSARTAKILEFQKKKNDAFIRLANATDADAPALAREYRAYANAYRSTRGVMGQVYEKKWTSSDRNFGLRNGKTRGASLETEVNAYWHKHQYIDLLQLPEPRHEDLVKNRADRERAEKLIEQHAPDFPVN